MNKRSYKFKKNISETLELPKEIILDIPTLKVIGNDSIIIENHKGVVKFCKDKIKVNTYLGVYTISGEDFIIKSIVKEEIIINGKILSIELLTI